MAPAKFREYVILAFCGFLVNLTFATPVSISLGSVSDLLIQSALTSLNDTSPTRHTYKSGNLISAQKLLEPSYVIYRLTLNLEPNCNGDSPCPREACAIDLRQHEQGVIDVQRNSIQCMYLYPQSVEADVQQQQPSQDSFQDINQEHEPIEMFEKRVINESVQLDHEVQTVTDDSDRPFIAVRAMDRNYCAGCAYELNPTLAGLSEFGEQVVQSMDATGRSDFKHKVVSIVKVTRAVPPGSNVIIYELLLEIGETNCVRIGLADRKECSLLINVPIQLCLVTFEQRPWQQDSRKIVRNNCTELGDSYNELNAHFEETVGTSEPLTMTAESMDTATSYGSSIDDFFKTVEHTTTTRSTNENSKIPITEESVKKIVVDREEEKRDRQGFINKVKEFDAFLEDFDVPIKNRDPEPTNHGVPVTEEIIRPEIVTRENADQSKDAPVSNHGNEQRQMRKQRSIVDATNDETNLVEKLAQKAVDELDEIDVDDKKRVLLDIIDWKKHSGDGTVYYITMKVAASNCIEQKENHEDCLDDIREPAKICKAQIFVNEERSLNAAKVLQSQCFEELNRRETRLKREVEALGAPSQLDTNNEEIKDYVEKGLSKYSETSGLKNEPFLFKIVEATTQIVSGTLYKIKVQLGESTCPKGEKVNCQLKSESQIEDYLITVWSQPWIDHGNPDIKIDLFTEKNAKRVRRSDRVLGGVSSKSIDDPEIRHYTEKALRKYSETSGLQNEPFLVEIVEATGQVVSGMKYRIKVRLGESTCPKGKKGNCSLKEGSQIDDYLITVWSQPWVDHGNPDIKVESFKEINAKRVRRSSNIPGGSFPKDIHDEEIRDYAEKGLRKYAETSGLTNEPFLVEIVEATGQVVSGMKYRIKVRLGESTCPKGKKGNCLLKDNSEINDYLITVWSQPWVDHGNPDIKVESFKEINAKRVRRSSNIPGGSFPKDIHDEEIRDYAEKGLRKYAETSGLTNEPFLVEIVEATGQVVSGMKYRIKVRLGESTCPKGKKGNCLLKDNSEINDYLITVWSQPWVDHGNPDIKVESLKEINAKRVRRSSNIPGGSFPKDIHDEEIRDYAEKGLRKYAETSGLTNEPFLVEIVEATGQVVSGMKYRIKVRLGESTCPKGKKENCSLKDNSQVNDYLITVWSQPWVDHGNPEITVKLFNEDKKISKRELRGKNYSQKMLKMRQEYENERAFNKFMNHYEKSYPTDEERNLRFKIFSENMKKVKLLRETEQGTAEYGATIFADLTPEEFRSRHLGFKPELRTENDIPFPKAKIPDIELPTEFDWRQKNIVTEVKDQGACGSCWAFAVTGNIEGLNAIKHGTLLSFSEQELIDCDKLDDGCEGGLPDNAYRSLESLGGLELENDYPYDGADETCHFNKTKARVSVVSGVNITSNETQMAQWLVQNGPIAIGINANAMQFYMGGISHPFKFLCNGDDLDHGVLIVGYGIHTYPLFKKKMPYWIIKNSWGKRWGEQGYYRVYRGDGTCGLNRMATSAVIA